jgi:hypothetical protein
MDRGGATDLLERSKDAAASLASMSADVASNVGTTATTVGSKVLETAIDAAGDVIDSANEVVQRVIDRRAPRSSWRPSAGMILGLVAVLAVVGAVVAQRARNRRAVDEHARDAGVSDASRAAAAA